MQAGTVQKITQESIGSKDAKDVKDESSKENGEENESLSNSKVEEEDVTRKLPNEKSLEKKPEEDGACPETPSSQASTLVLGQSPKKKAQVGNVEKPVAKASPKGKAKASAKGKAKASARGKTKASAKGTTKESAGGNTKARAKGLAKAKARTKVIKTDLKGHAKAPMTMEDLKKKLHSVLASALMFLP